MPPGRVASFGAGPWEWWGRPGSCGQALALRQATFSSPTGTSPSFCPGFWLVRGPLWGQLCGPGQRGPALLFAEGGKTTRGLLIQPHLGAPGSAARVCPGCPAGITQGWWAWSEQGGCWGLWTPAGQGWATPAFPRKQSKRTRAPVFDGGRGSGPQREGTPLGSLRLPCQAPVPPRGCASLQVTVGLGPLC